MNPKKIPTLLLFSALAMMARGADSPKSPLTVAVYDFTGEAVAASYGKPTTSLVTADLAAETNLALVERVELAKSLQEQAFGVSGLVSSEAAAQIGQITGARVLVAGQVLKTGDSHLVIVANIIGTETGRLFAEKVEGGGDNLVDLTAQLSRKIARTISDQTTNLIAGAQESREESLERIVKGVTGTNRPSVSVSIVWATDHARHTPSAETEFGLLLLKAGFKVVDDKSDRKPDVEIAGVEDTSPGPRQGGLYSFRAVIDLKVQERRSGAIIAFAHEEGSATGAASASADKSAKVNAVDALAEKVLPLLAK
ncbi:MAG: CsgG/HfaB family protein [Verrucomicrobiota bacterium]|jgi:TolB-like protein